MKLASLTDPFDSLAEEKLTYININPKEGLEVDVLGYFKFDNTSARINLMVSLSNRDDQIHLVDLDAPFPSTLFNEKWAISLSDLLIVGSVIEALHSAVTNAVVAADIKLVIKYEPYIEKAIEEVIEAETASQFDVSEGDIGIFLVCGEFQSAGFGPASELENYFVLAHA